MQSSSLLSLMVAGASIIGAFLYANFQKEHPTEVTSVDSINKILVLEDKVKQLQAEIVTLRELAQQTGDIQLPEAVKKFIERNIGLTFKTVPSILLEDEDAIFKAAQSSWIKHFSEDGMHYRSTAFEKIGLMPPNNFLNQLAISATGPGTARAVYDHSRNIILVPKNFDINHIDDCTFLGKELAVALINQNHPAEKNLTDDSWLARRSIIQAQSQATAQHLKVRYAKEFGLLGSELNNPVDSKIMSEAFTTFQSMPLYVKFIYALSTTYAGDYLLKNAQENTAKTLSYCLKKATSTSVFFTTHQAEAKTVSKTDNALIFTSLGPSAVHVHSLRGELKQAHKVSTSYKNDQLTVVKLANGDYVTKWSIQFTTAEAASLFGTHLQNMLTNNQDSSELKVSAGTVTVTITQKPLAE